MPEQPTHALNAQEKEVLLQTLQLRFHQNPQRHPGLAWNAVEARLLQAQAPIAILQWMERTGGEPDVVEALCNGEAFAFCDCAPETPIDRRNLCYDAEALASRKANKPRHSAVGMAAEMGIRLLNEAEYLLLQATGAYDCKTSSWLLTPPELRSAGGALFGDKRYGRAFIYHNGAESYYTVRGFRGIVML